MNLVVVKAYPAQAPCVLVLFNIFRLRDQNMVFSYIKKPTWLNKVKFKIMTTNKIWALVAASGNTRGDYDYG